MPSAAFGEQRQAAAAEKADAEARAAVAEARDAAIMRDAALEVACSQDAADHAHQLGELRAEIGRLRGSLTHAKLGRVAAPTCALVSECPAVMHATEAQCCDCTRPAFTPCELLFTGDLAISRSMLGLGSVSTNSFCNSTHVCRESNTADWEMRLRLAHAYVGQECAACGFVPGSDADVAAQRAVRAHLEPGSEARKTMLHSHKNQMHPRIFRLLPTINYPVPQPVGAVLPRSHPRRRGAPLQGAEGGDPPQHHFTHAQHGLRGAPPQAAR